MAKTLRVHHLAKQIGVPSKEIIAKCNAEGVEPPLKNHMAAVSLGLAESIREWFSTGDDVTTIEVADAVDLTKIRKTKPKTQLEESPAEQQVAVAEPESPPDTETETETPPAAEPVIAFPSEEPAVAAEQPETLEPAARQETDEPAGVQTAPADDATITVSQPEVPETTQEEADAAQIAAVGKEATDGADVLTEVLPAAETADADSASPGPADDEDAKSESPAKPVIAEPPKPPVVIAPAGPQVVPTPAELKGPRVVRIEAPEPVRQPRPRPARPAASTTTTSAPAQSDRGPARKPRGKKGWTETAAPRGRSPRRHGSGSESIERLKEWRDQDLIERKERLASATGHGVRARRSAERRRSGGPATPHRKADVEITTPIGAKEFCAAVGVPFNVIFAKLMEQTGRPFRITDTFDAETCETLAVELGVSLIVKKELSAIDKIKQQFAQRERNSLQPRPPVVAMLGHVDHGKTSLLDAIRKTDVAAGESGGITQHIGASRVKHGNWNVTFLDTPGHKAFTAMRSRGANLTDVVVLVIAADDGVMPQTIEALNHAKASGVQIVIALNKIDLPGVDLNKVYAQLAEHELAPAEWGGSTDIVKTSATTGEGVEDLLTHLSTLSELMELAADPTVPAQATVVEAQMREGRGIVVQVLVREGTLKVGDIVVCGPASGRIRSLLDSRGKRMKKVEPGAPAEVLGLDELPQAGDELYVVDNQSEAKRTAQEVRQQRRAEALVDLRKPRTLEDLLKGNVDGEVPELNVIVRADVQGSVDALRNQLGEFPTDKARLKVLHYGVGAITEADVELARASSAIVIGFNVVTEDHAKSLADEYGVETRTYRVIYDVTDDLQKALEGLLEPDRQEEHRGRVEVRQVFNVSRVGTIAGCFVTSGIVKRNFRTRLVRDGRIINEGLGIGSLKRFKDDVREVKTGFECGIKLEGFDDIKPNDIIEVYEIVEVAQRL